MGGFGAYTHTIRSGRRLFDESLCVRLCGKEMTEKEHRELANVLFNCKGKVVLSGYPSPLYNELYGHWKSLEFDIANHAAGGKSKARKQETIWINWKPHKKN